MLVQAIIINVIIDLSHWNGNVNFKLAKEDGIRGVIHKATQGTSYVDPKYTERRVAAEKEGLLWGAYHFATNGNGATQANHFLKTVGNTTNVLLVIDIEENTSGGGNITPNQAESFVNTIKQKTGRCPVIYGSASFLNRYATPVLTKCPLWIARYGSQPSLPKGWNKWTMWQYTDGKSGLTPRSVKGIGACDRNKFNGDLGQLQSFWGK